MFNTLIRNNSHKNQDNQFYLMTRTKREKENENGKIKTVAYLQNVMTFWGFRRDNHSSLKQQSF